jgi:serine phosphatase RsbU (regulator of sigma subunit)
VVTYTVATMAPAGINLETVSDDESSGASCAPPHLTLDELAAALGSVDEGVIVRERGGKIVWANDHAASALGFDSVEELLETPSHRITRHYEIFDLEGRPVPAERLPNRLADEGQDPPPAILRYWRDSSPEAERWSEVRSRPIKEPDGKVRCTITFFRDVTATQGSLLALRQSRARLALLNKVGTALLDASLDAHAVLDRVAGLVVPEIADYCSLLEVHDDGSIQRTAFRHADPSRAELVENLLAYDAAASEGVRRVARTGEPVLLREIPEHMLRSAARDERHLALMRELDPKSALVVPIPARGKIVAVISLVSAESGRRFSEEDLVLVEDIVRRAGLAIDNARLYEQRSSTAHILQQSLLPPELPDIPGVELAARYVPAEGEIGGDFYDVIYVGSGRWLLAIGDVCGKGPEAAIFTSMVRYTLRAAASEAQSPSAMLRMVNSTIIRQVPKFQFCTLACAVLVFNEETPCLTISLAGHPQPLIIGSAGEVKSFGREGTLLGGFKDPTFSDESVLLQPGEVVMFFTDGALDRYDTGTRGLEEHLAQVGAAKEDLDAHELAKSLEEFVVSRRPARWADDLAILALRVLN